LAVIAMICAIAMSCSAAEETEITIDMIAAAEALWLRMAASRST